jgi:hypothetical protein
MGGFSLGYEAGEVRIQDQLGFVFLLWEQQPHIGPGAGVANRDILLPWGIR